MEFGFSGSGVEFRFFSGSGVCSGVEFGLAREWSLGCSSLAREWSLGCSSLAREWLARVKVKLSDSILGRILWLGSGVEVESGVGSVLWQLSDVCRIDGVKYI